MGELSYMKERIYGATTKEWIRFEAARSALVGLLADSEDRENERKDGESCAQATARLAVEYADALLEELSK